MKHRCPVCNREVVFRGGEKGRGESFFPFCCRRCRLVDLGAWLDGEYKVVTQLGDDDSPEHTGTPEDGL